MISVRNCGRFRRKYSSVAPSTTPSVAPLDFSPPSESGDELSNQPARLSEMKSPLADTLVTVTNIPKYSKDDLQKILKAVLEV